MCRESLIDFGKYTPTIDGLIYSKIRRRFLKLQATHFTNKPNYLYTELRCIDGKSRCYYVHRVVWYYFKGEIPEGMQVNHMNENTFDNILSNLNLLTPKDNSNWGTRNERISSANTGRHHSDEAIYKMQHSKRCMPVLQYNLETKEPIKEWVSASEAARQLGLSQSQIQRCCVNKRTSYGGYGWKYI